MLILGGYGRAGKNIARLLGQNSQHHVILAGRSIGKAEKCCDELNSELNKNIFTATKIDVEIKADLRSVLDQVEVVIVCLPLNEELANNLIHTVLDSKCKAYLDISPGEEKHYAFQMNHHLIEESEKVFVLDGGCEPGMPAVLIKFLKTINPDIRKVKINVVYRDRNMPDGSIQDLLSHDEKGIILEDGILKTAKKNIKKVMFPLGFGRLRTVPVWIPELENIHINAEITDLEYRHAGINGVSNVVSLFWKSLLRYFLPIKIGVKLFKWAIKRFTKEPLGGLMIIEGYNESEKTTIKGYHEDIYVATAIPAAAATLLILNNSMLSPGRYFMNEVVNIPEFIDQVCKMGFEIKVRSE